MEKNASILVVDDDKEIADLVEIYLVNDGRHGESIQIGRASCRERV